MQTIGDVMRRDAKYALIGVAAGIWLAVAQSPVWGGVVIAVFLTESILLWMRTKAGAWMSFFTLGLAAVWFAWLIYSKGFTAGRGICLGFMLFSLWGNWLNFGDLLLNRATIGDPDDNDLRPLAKDSDNITGNPKLKRSKQDPANNDTSDADEEDDDDDNKPLTSIVLLRRTPKALDEKILLDTVRDAWDEHRKLGEDEIFVASQGFINIVRSPQAMWMVHNHPRSYFDGNPVPQVPDLRLRKALEEHTAWLSVDLMQGFLGDLPTDVYYPYIFRLIRELADDDTLAILRPETGQINLWNEEVARSLGSMDPLEDFATPTQAPVISVSDEDPRMKAAIDEARRTFDTFREHWATRGPQDAYLVKAPIRDGKNSEIIWIEVTGLEPDYVHGTLANAPVNVEGHRLGDLIEVPIADLYDWGIAKQGADAPLGLFTEKVVREVQQEAHEAMHQQGPGPDAKPA
jgi:uncharacterized protein YegJ (DUF2314 family)